MVCKRKIVKKAGSVAESFTGSRLCGYYLNPHSVHYYYGEGHSQATGPITPSYIDWGLRQGPNNPSFHSSKNQHSLWFRGFLMVSLSHFHIWHTLEYNKQSNEANCKPRTLLSEIMISSYLTGSWLPPQWGKVGYFIHKVAALNRLLSP